MERKCTCYDQPFKKDGGKFFEKYSPITDKLLIVLIVRAHLKSTRQKYMPASSMVTGSMCNNACGLVDNSNLARFDKLSDMKCLANSIGLLRASIEYIGDDLRSFLYHKIKLI